MVIPGSFKSFRACRILQVMRWEHWYGDPCAVWSMAEQLQPTVTNSDKKEISNKNDKT
jgi:hypothetical protein